MNRAGSGSIDHVIGEWFSVVSNGKDYHTMVYYPGTGGNTFEFNFVGGYINRSDIKAYMVKDGTEELTFLGLTFSGPNTVRTHVPVPVGYTVLIYRDTPKDKPLAAFQDGAVINAINLSRNAEQAIYAIAEIVDKFGQTDASLGQAYTILNDFKNDVASMKANIAQLRSDLTMLTGRVLSNEGQIKSLQQIVNASRRGRMTVSTEGPTGIPGELDEWVMIGDVDQGRKY